MSHVCGAGFGCVIVALSGCEPSSEAFNWPSFDDKVIEVGRRVMQARAEDRLATFSLPFNGQRVKEVEPVEVIAATRDAVLKRIKVLVDVGGKKGGRAGEAVRALGAEAIDPLLEILADDSVGQRYVDRAVGLLIPLGVGRQDVADDIFDAVVDYGLRHREAQPNVGGLVRITGVERIPRVIELIESSTGERQRAYIGIFSGLTYTRFLKRSGGMCGSFGSVDVSKIHQLREEQQRESVVAIKAWWAEHKGGSQDAWFAATLLGSIDEKRVALDAEFGGGDDAYRQSREDQVIREYHPPRVGLWRSSAFGMLVKEYEKAPEHLRPYVLRMIGRTGHADAADFVASRLKSADINLQYAAMGALKDLKVSGHKEALGDILGTTMDLSMAFAAIDALKKLEGADAIEDLANALGHAEYFVRGQAKQALHPYLVSHADRLWEIARSHPSEQVRGTLGAILDGAAATALAKADAGDEERIASTRALLRSDDAERQKLGIGLAAGYPELIPDVLELIRSVDSRVRRKAVELIQKKGIPKLTVEDAPRLMGYSSELDRRIAAYCYAKYGRAAVPIMKRAAFVLSDPMNPEYAPAYPAFGLIRVLVEEKVPGVEEQVVRLVKGSRFKTNYVGLLEFLDDSKCALLVSELLRHEESHIRWAAMDMAGYRRLTQVADQLVELAGLTFDQSEYDGIEAEAERGGITKKERRRLGRRVLQRPQDQYGATLSLIELDDPRAWQAVMMCLQNGHLKKRKQSSAFGVLPVFSDFGVTLSRLKASHGGDMRALLRKELSGKNREDVVVSLTTALGVDPEAGDSDVLWSVASAAHAHKRARILAVVGLSKLGEPRVIPLLHKFVRSFMAQGTQGTTAHSNPSGLFSLSLTTGKCRMRHPRPSLLDTGSRRPFDSPLLERHQVDLGLALRRLGDETLVDELVEALPDVRGGFNLLAYQFLGGLVGLRAHDYARQWIASQEVDNPALVSAMAVMLLDLEVPLEDVLPLIVEDDEVLQYSLHALVGCDGREASDALVKAYPVLSRFNKQLKWHIFDTLCRAGDLRGIDLAAQNPLHMASFVRYLPESPGVDFTAAYFDYNRIEEGMRIQAWYEQHAGDLRWDVESSQFRLACQAP